MDVKDVIVVTGAAGFIGSYLTGFLNSLGYYNLILVDDFSNERKTNNYIGKKYLQQIQRDVFFDYTENNKYKIQYVFHLGARTDTTEMNYEIHKKWNLDYSKKMWNFCSQNKIPLIYASSAATYGNGSLGYNDSHDIVQSLQPLNPYGISKNEFDIWALQQKIKPPYWAGLKFFNVYGPNEYHKGRMASVILHAFYQIHEKGMVQLFRSHNPEFKDGEQMRDFIYVKDVVKIAYWLMQNKPESGLYNTGSGKARTFNDLVKTLFSVLNKPDNINYIDTPIDIRDKYQYFTEANMTKLLSLGYPDSFYSLENGITEYVKNYLLESNYF